MFIDAIQFYDKKNASLLLIKTKILYYFIIKKCIAYVIK